MIEPLCLKKKLALKWVGQSKSFNRRNKDVSREIKQQSPQWDVAPQVGIVGQRQFIAGGVDLGN
jgi:hypothetical protein